ncbi:E3 ubiquitin-protein ligase AMFR-like isoform X2 [Varroa destructor]|uniref:RING-type domain-containing protein n=1 Tax=Varroa destructor TaxID=109461 RepID=A0A7M7KL82_VARDE|nr:E3 ubiquitin-protein ligase AMFR-like isoform X2 [Varroa destructor]
MSETRISSFSRLAVTQFPARTVVNMAYCILGLLGKFIHLVVFGQLRISEEQHLKDKFWNFVFYKFIFIFGVLNVQHVEQVIAWVVWFSLLGFLHLMTTLSKDRFQYLSFSPSVPVGAHVRLVGLLSCIQAVCALCFGVCMLCGIRYGVHTFALMLAEVALVALNAGYVLARYVYVPHASAGAGAIPHEVESGKGDKAGVAGGAGFGACPVYYTELVFELATLAVDFLHHLHMLVWTNTMLSMASLVISMQLRWAFNEIRRRVLKHRNYLRVLRHMMVSYPMAAASELRAAADNCAICWELMLSARRLPCGHLFHNACLRSWLEQDTSCPTCRLTLQSSDSPSSSAFSDRSSLFGALTLSSLRVEAEASLRPTMPLPARSHTQHLSVADSATVGSSQHFRESDVVESRTTTVEPQQQQAATTNHHLFTFDGSRYFSWLPSVSLEVSHSNLLRPAPQASTSPVDTVGMARHVSSISVGSSREMASTTSVVAEVAEGVREYPFSSPTRRSSRSATGQQQKRRHPLELSVGQPLRSPQRTQRIQRTLLRPQQQHLPQTPQKFQQRPIPLHRLVPILHANSEGDMTANQGFKMSSGVGTQRGDLDRPRPLPFDCKQLWTCLESSSYQPTLSPGGQVAGQNQETRGLLVPMDEDKVQPIMGQRAEGMREPLVTASAAIRYRRVHQRKLDLVEASRRKFLERVEKQQS